MSRRTQSDSVEVEVEPVLFRGVGALAADATALRLGSRADPPTPAHEHGQVRVVLDAATLTLTLAGSIFAI